MQYPELPICAFLAALLVLVPFPWHWRARNVATLSVMAWLFVVNLIYGVNAIIWAGNVNNPAPVWCDITTKIIVGASYALPLSMLCICKHLEMVSSSRKVQYDLSDKRRRMILEGIMCFGVPMIFMALHYIVQGHRYDIFENTGCQASIYISLPAVFLVWFPQLLFSVITLIYAAIAIHHFIRRRLTFAAHLQNSNSALTTNRYLRLIAMAVTEMVWGTVFTAYNLYNNVSPGLRPWTNWADVHSNFSRVDIFATAGIPPEFIRSMMVFWWAMPASALIFFLFFGFGEEAKKEYRRVWNWIKITILRRPAPEAPVYTGSFPNSHNHRPNNLSPSLGLKKLFLEKKEPPSNASELTVSPPTPIKSHKAPSSADPDSYTIATFSYYSQSTDSMRVPSPSASHAHHHYQSGHHISISEAHAASRAPSPALSASASVSEDSYVEARRDPASPTFHRPFSPPSIYPIAAPHPGAGQSGNILVTIHRQASVDHIV